MIICAVKVKTHRTNVEYLDSSSFFLMAVCILVLLFQRSQRCE